ncbi:hypothetical protein DPMN_057371 [Dreissena polymorpha]|uniref:Uncharacterized protein n=1 Tax=Dreissena polymorpha TaxID=45954 RepID=A0A9D4HEQ2_DREPO|nr:hypothetical protein DPMN_057371 [Dreissena polymorpha]
MDCRGCNLVHCHKYCTKNVTSRVLTIFQYRHIGKTARLLAGMFNEPKNIFNLRKYIKCHGEWTKMKTAPPLAPIQTNVLTKFHEDWTINVSSRVFTRFFKLGQDIIWTNILTKFNEDSTINVTSRVLTR